MDQNSSSPIRFSIITPCFNSRNTIRRTIESVLNQSYGNFEYIIIDGASKDDTLDIINEYKDRFDGRLTVISEPDKGIYDAMNKGIRKATGDFVGIINSDDWYEKDALANVAEAEKNFVNQDGCEAAYRLYYGILRFVEADGRERRAALYHHEFLEDNMINHPTVFLARKVYEDFGLYDTEYRAVADYDYMLKLKESRKVNFVPLYKVQANFQLGGMTDSYTSVVEAMKVKKLHGIISDGKYAVLRVLLWMRKLLGFLSNE